MPRRHHRLHATVALGFLTCCGALGCGGRRETDVECPRLPAATVSARPRPPTPSVAGADTAVPRPPQRFILDADTAFRREDTSLVRLCGVRLVLLDATGREVARLRSDHGDYDPATEGITVRDRVEVDVTEGQRRLLTEELHYAPREDRVWSPVETTFQRPGMQVHADSFVADSRFERVRAFATRGTFHWE